MDNNTNSAANGNLTFGSLISGQAGVGQSSSGVTTKAFLLNLAVGFGLFAFQLSGFFLLKSSKVGRRLYQPKTYLVQQRLRVEAIPGNPWKWIRRIFSISSEELKLKCGLDGYFSIRFIRAMIVIFLPLMALIIIILLPVNYHEGAFDHSYQIGKHTQQYNVTGLDTLSWQNVPPTKTDRYWAHLVCALMVIGWTLWRIYCEKAHLIRVRQEYLTSPEYRLRASARTILVTNIPSEYRSEAALKALFDVFIDNDDRNKLHIWVNRDYKELRTLVARRRKLCHALEKAELKTLRRVNKQVKGDRPKLEREKSPNPSQETAVDDEEATMASADAQQLIWDAFETECEEHDQLWRKHLKDKKEPQIKLTKDETGSWQPASSLKFWQSGHRSVPKVAYLRAKIASLTIKIDALLPDLDKDSRFGLQNSAFVQFDRQMQAHMAAALATHHSPGVMAPRYLHVAPHEILWPNMGLTSLWRFIRTVIALVLFVAIVIFWGIPATFLSIISQLETLRSQVSYLRWLESWPTWIVSLISGPLATILLALLIQLVVPALCRKLAVLVGAPTRSRREVITQGFYFTFLFIELVLVTSISSGLIATIPTLIDNPASIASTLAKNLPKAANYFFNYLIIQALGFSGSVLFQYLRILFITTIWPWFTQTPREEAWLQTTIPHQMWANVFSMWTNFAAIALIYSVIAPLMLIWISIVFCLFWVAYRHNYYFVQRNKVDTHGMLFENALSQLLSGIYVLEITLIGLFFLVRDTQDNVVCTPQAIIMIVALALTAAYHFVIEQLFRPLYDLLPVTLEDKAVDAERQMFEENENRPSEEQAVDRESNDTADASDKKTYAKDMRFLEKPRKDENEEPHHIRRRRRSSAGTAANARKTMAQLHHRIDAKVAAIENHTSHLTGIDRKMEVADQLAASLANYPDELIDLTPEERDAELRAAYQDPVTREPQPVIWIPQDEAGVSEDSIKHAKKYGKYLLYSNAGAYLTRKNKCEVTQPAPDVRSDWLLDWVL